MDKVIGDIIMLATSAGVGAYASSAFAQHVAALYMELAKMIPVLG